MHFPTFAVASTNIFPLVNSTKGGQLVTEYNLRSREMVGTDPDITYEVGPSYTHGQSDFAVSLLSDMEAPEYSDKETYSIGQYVTYNSVTYVCIDAIVKPEPFDSANWIVVSSASSILQIAPGRAVINGHYVETLAPMIVDLALANAQLAKNYEAPLLGELTIGIRTYYSTESTMAGSMLVENEDNTYTGVQLVILKKEEFKTPIDSPTDRSLVTADLKLADFVYINGVINPAAIVQNKNKVSYINSERIDDISQVLDDNFISKKNLDAQRLYTFSGQGMDSGKDTWCDSTGSLMIWDSDPASHITTTNPNVAVPQATFLSTADGYVHLAVPHQQIDRMKNTAGQDIYYGLRDIRFPKANYVSGTPGTVDAQYTQVIKDLADKVNGLKQSPAGKLILWLETKEEDYEMPSINTNYENGDYIFVREDRTVAALVDGGSYPSTMYKVIPGSVSNVEYTADLPSGIRLGDTAVTITAAEEPELDPDVLKYLANAYNTETAYSVDDIVAYNEGMYKCISATQGAWDQSAWERVFNSDAVALFAYSTYRGTINADYFEVDYYNSNNELTAYYYKVSGTGARAWSDAVLITGGIPLATVDQIGGFYNTDSTATDGGYVTLDESGRLKLIDYELLRTGALAYQLGEDFTLPTNITSETVQANLDEYVNSRVAFPFASTLDGTASMINIYITLPAEQDPTTINIYNIDSRFGTSVCLHFLGEANSNTTINIIDCEKIKIDSNISGTPVINVIRSCIYYDANVFNYIRVCDTRETRAVDFTGFLDITLWYDKLLDTDADLQVNGMEISQPNAPMSTEDISFWNEANPNDNHYSAALRSITLAGNGDIVECSLYVSNSSTATNVTSGRSIIGGTFNLPQGSELVYPTRCVTKPLKVTGSFTTAYLVENANWVVIATNFTVQTGVYDSNTDVISSGTIAFDSTTDLLSSENMTMNVSVIDGWRPGSYHIFYGGTTIGGVTI